MTRYIFIVLLVLLPATSFAQIDVNTISLEFGYVRNYQSGMVNDKLFALSPEMKIGGIFFDEFFEWDFNISYWQDGITEPFPAADFVTYSYSSTNLGLRLNYFPQKLQIPFHFIAGTSTRFVNKKYIGGFDYTGNHNNSNSFILYTVDFGAGLDLMIVKKLRARLDGIMIIPLNKMENIERQGRSSSLKLGIDYFIN